MKTIIVDDNKGILDGLIRYCNRICELEIVGKFIDPFSVLNYIKTNTVDLAILDIEMPEMNGVELGEKLKSINPNILIIYCTGHEDYALDAFKLHSIAYLLKPFSFEDFEQAIATAKVLYANKARNIKIQTFGRFDVFINDELIIFKRAKAKELLALLVDNKGGLVTLEQAIDVLWEDRPYNKNVKQMYRDATSQLRYTLKQYGCLDLIKVVRGGCYIDLSKFHCDYYDFLNNKQYAVKMFTGQYMYEYSWAEETLAQLESISNLENV